MNKVFVVMEFVPEYDYMLDEFVYDVQEIAEIFLTKELAEQYKSHRCSLGDCVEIIERPVLSEFDNDFDIYFD